VSNGPTIIDVPETVERAKGSRWVLIEAARQDPAVFAAMVMKDDMTGKAVRLTPTHEAWHDLLSKHESLVIWAHISSGKTSGISIVRTLWEIGRNPNLRVLILSNTHSQASKITNAIARYVEQSSVLHEIFPNLKKSGETWRPTSGMLTVQRTSFAKDPTITSSGIHGNILGARYDLVILDDVLDYENTRTPEQRRILEEWLQSTVHGRLTEGARMWVVGTAFHPDDVLHTYARKFSDAAKGQRAFRYPVVDDAGVSRWPDAWPQSRIESMKQKLSPIEFARQLLCVARDDSEARFKREWIDKALLRGFDKRPVNALERIPPGCSVYTGVDLAVKQHAAADMTVFFTILAHPNGDREVLNIEAGRWAGPDIVQRVMDTHRRYGSIVIVEDNAAQEFILQFTKNVSAVPVRSFTTTSKNKHSPEFGVESLAAEMVNGKWIIPSAGGVSKEIQEWIDEMLYYQPSAHTGDRLMACWMAREAARQVRPKAQRGFLDLASR